MIFNTKEIEEQVSGEILFEKQTEFKNKFKDCMREIARLKNLLSIAETNFVKLRIEHEYFFNSTE